MTALLFTAPTFRPLTIAGAIMPNAYVQFYESGTTTPTDVYADAGLGTPLSNPVVADANGEFVPIYLDRRVRYRAQIYDENDVLLLDVDPLGTTADFQPGTVVMFFGDETARDAAYPPTEWGICDGTDGTPDLVGRFPKGVDAGEAAGDTGGAAGAVTSSPAGGHDHGGATDPFTLTTAEMPGHAHAIYTANGPGGVIARPNAGDPGVYGISGAAYAGGAVNTSYQPVTTGDGAEFIQPQGGDGAHAHDITAETDHAHDVDVDPPYCALWFLMRLP